ncbi:MAG TPA: serine/threonine-protein kinase [Polyangiales bacterium]
MLICPKCRTSYTSSLGGACYKDGEKLVDHDAFLALERDPMRGRTIGGKYTILERIGVGGMGNVYKASQAGLSRHVAVKILKTELTRDADTVARFSREATAMSLLTHANTTRVYDFGQTEDGLLYLVMEYLEGQLITQRVAQHGPLPIIETLRIAEQILRSLAEAHTKGLVHRDLKPDNIFIAKAEGHHAPIVKVLDFGIAKVVAPDRRMDQFETQAGTVFGTPRYMSPEQAQGAPLDQRSDLYSVGALLYQMLTGRAPFTDDDAVVVMAKHIQELPELPSKVVPERHIPDSLEAVVMKAMAKSPAERFQTAAEFEAALEACVVDVVHAETETGSPRRPRSARRNLAWALSAFSLAAASYAGFRVLAKVAEPQLSPALYPDASLAQRGAEPAAIADVTAPAEPRPEEPVLAEGPEPAVVAIRSEPRGATVFRDGARLGETPISLLVKPTEQFVRVELRLSGYQPLAAELTAQDGERTFKLNKDAVRRPVRGARAAIPRHTAAPKPAADATPAAAKPADPYPRFD